VRMRRRGRLTSAAALLIGATVAGLAAACAAPPAAGNRASVTSGGGAARPVASAPPGTISTLGSGLLQPLMTRWAQGYQQKVPGLKVYFDKKHPGGSTNGINDAATGLVEIGTSDAYLSAGDVQSHPGLLNIPVAVSAQSVLYNLPAVPASRAIRLSGTVIAQMYAGRITMWNDQRVQAINPGVPLPAVKVVPVHRTIGAGDTFIFTSYLSTQDDDWKQSVGYGTLVAWPPNPADVKADGSVNTYQVCARTPGCITYNGLGYLADEQRAGLAQAMLRNTSGSYVLPTSAAINSEVDSFVAITPPSATIAMVGGPAAGGYPIVNYEYAIINPGQLSPAQASQVKAFLSWVVTTGNEDTYLNQSGFRPLRPDIQQLAQALIGGITR
jgi:phosphate transport system substrate-binding protein